MGFAVKSFVDPWQDNLHDNANFSRSFRTADLTGAGGPAPVWIRGWQSRIQRIGGGGGWKLERELTGSMGIKLVT